MRIIIVGGGKVGGYVARQLSREGHAVTVAELSSRAARRLGEENGLLVLEGDGTNIEVLRAAEAGRADWLLAVTGLDEENLVACELGSTLGVKRVLARLNDPRNRPTFDALEIPVVAVTDLIGEVIEREVDLVDLERLAFLGRGRISLIRVEIEAGVPPRRVVDLNLPPETILVSATKGDRVVVPGAETVLEPGDRVLAVTLVQQEADVRRALCEPAATTDG